MEEILVSLVGQKVNVSTLSVSREGCVDSVKNGVLVLKEYRNNRSYSELNEDKPYLVGVTYINLNYITTIDVQV